MAEREYLTRQDAVDITTLSITTIDRLIRAGQLPAVRVGRRVLIPRRGFEAWLQAQPPQEERL
jgi:excisionase family DNA binding protein